MNLHGLTRRWAVLLVTSTAVTLILGAGPGPARWLAVAVLFGVGPGVAMRPLLALGDRLVDAVVTVMVSLGLTLVVSESLAIAHAWTLTRVVLVIAGICLIGSLLPRPRAVRS